MATPTDPVDNVIEALAALSEGAQEAQEYAVVLDGGNVIVGFEAWEQAIGYARENWGATIPDDYRCGDEVTDGTPVLSVSEVTRLSDWGRNQVGA